jgi:AraC-like DNA-binding protein
MVVRKSNEYDQADTSPELEEFNVYTDLSDLPLDENPKYLDECIVGVCTEGSAFFSVFSNKRKVIKNDLITIFPYQLACATDFSEDFSMTFLKVPKKMFLDTICGTYRPTLEYFFYMRKNFSLPLCEEECDRFIHFCYILSFRIDLPCSYFRRESIMNLLKVFFWDMYVSYKNSPQSEKPIRYTHKEKKMFDFFCLVIEYHTVSRDVAFYAEKMHISPKYLTMLMTENSGRSAKEWIVEYTILEIKALLRDSSLEIKEVVSRTNFQSNSVMTRFFREYTGMTPTEYRERESF